MWRHLAVGIKPYVYKCSTALRGGARGRRAVGGHGEELHLAPRDAEHVAHLDRPPLVLDEEVGRAAAVASASAATAFAVSAAAAAFARAAGSTHAHAVASGARSSVATHSRSEALPSTSDGAPPSPPSWSGGPIAKLPLIRSVSEHTFDFLPMARARGGVAPSCDAGVTASATSTRRSRRCEACVEV